MGSKIFNSLLVFLFLYLHNVLEISGRNYSVSMSCYYFMDALSKTRLWTGGGVKSHCLELKNEDQKSSTQTLQSTCMSGSFGNYIPS